LRRRPLNSLQQLAAIFGSVLQQQLFPVLEEELGPLSERMREFIRALALLKLDSFITVQHGRGRPKHDRSCIARAFLAKAIFNLVHTRALLDRLAQDAVLRRLCGWERADDIPDETVFSRAFQEFAASAFAQRVHEALIERTRAQRLVGHLSRDSSAILAREKASPKTPKAQKRRRLHRRAGSVSNVEDMSPVERQWRGGMSLEQMLEEMPRSCDRGCKPNALGYKESWVGYKLHLDVADGQIPISCLLSSASMNDMQAAIPLACMSEQRVVSCYALMDTGYDCTAIREHSRSQGHVPIIPCQKRGSQPKPELTQHEKMRYRERSAAERVYSRLKERYGADHVRVRGWAKVMAHLMFGILALTADQVLRWMGLHPYANPFAPA
jgi:Transposase DDE domain/Transposase domain (DUF772)